MSRVEDLLENMLGEAHEIGAPESRIEKILQTALGLHGDISPTSSLTESLLKQAFDIQESQPLQGEKGRIDAILNAYLAGREYNEPRLSRVEDLLYQVLFDGSEMSK